MATSTRPGPRQCAWFGRVLWGRDAATGHATILGDDPLHLVITNHGVFKSSPRPYEGRYPCGSQVHDGVWYYGTYCLHPSGRVDRDGIRYNWPWLGPFVGFRWSTDLGKTWTQTPCSPDKPLFGEKALKGEPVKVGAPHLGLRPNSFSSPPDCGCGWHVGPANSHSIVK